VDVLVQALTHDTFFNWEHHETQLSPFSHRRQEFLGDSILEFIVHVYVCEAGKSLKFVDHWTEGKNRLRNLLLEKCSIALGIHEVMMVQLTVLDADALRKLRADMFESVVGALFIDQGLKETLVKDAAGNIVSRSYDVAGDFVHTNLLSHVAEIGTITPHSIPPPESYLSTKKPKESETQSSNPLKKFTRTSRKRHPNKSQVARIKV